MGFEPMKTGVTNQSLMPPGRPHLATTCHRGRCCDASHLVAQSLPGGTYSLSRIHSTTALAGTAAAMHATQLGRYAPRCCSSCGRTAPGPMSSAQTSSCLCRTRAAWAPRYRGGCGGVASWSCTRGVMARVAGRIQHAHFGECNSTRGEAR